MAEPLKSTSLEVALQATITASMSPDQLQAVTEFMGGIGVSSDVSSREIRVLPQRPSELLKGVFLAVVEARTRRASHGIHDPAIRDRVLQRQARLFLEAAADR